MHAPGTSATPRTTYQNACPAGGVAPSVSVVPGLWLATQATVATAKSPEAFRRAPRAPRTTSYAVAPASASHDRVVASAGPASASLTEPAGASTHAVRRSIRFRPLPSA